MDDHRWHALTPDDLKKYDRAAWAAVYQSVKPAVALLTKLLGTEFDAFREQSGKDRDVGPESEHPAVRNSRLLTSYGFVLRSRH